MIIIIVEVEKVSKTIGSREIIHDLSFSVEKGRTFALLGPNGAGKTTTVRLITCLLIPETGKIRIFNTDLNPKNGDILRQKIGVQNDGNLYEDLSIRQNLELWGQLYQIKNEDSKEQIKEILNFFNLEDRIDSKVGTLSKGMRQKVSIARAVFHHPELLILDEPTSGLDPQSMEELITYLNKLVNDSGMSIIMCTHQLQGLEEIADDIGIIQTGQLIKSGSASEVISGTFSETIYELEVFPKEKAINICKRFGTIHATSRIAGFRLSVTGKILISQIVKCLVKSDIEVNTIFEVKHTIKDAYFKIVGGIDND
ncbi:ABC transporter ATP-binding protein [Melissococcus plutonius]|uniref:ATP-binding protein of ABC transporter n=1 Tax=Melissococcus plutonius (strain ATCC 35311 / DSM 29964 / CIP 104052 / LMG 20360 / NCIMB 702443) TaxID=940190 RepID=F3YCK4_MELPT|nr:ABC transporter ATP-binding protein [Melissococcus plutonius]KMT30505.1 ATP-binding protein of ABC transporter [Melissococcus plutonius]KMT32975.1 ATP-binding protein of ABC transporter [Melissococcus plutonius]KMT40868.1 ATP-binding protein of ABC transporter [Melissococcus plutonius]MBB5177658.1 ABC-2 type transport system ATP-binding protein [Melissococcus plutonius]BAK22232.1 ATP-binding protein of ABC transporter [Melissococcus plutonius ATCC 35311]